MREKHEILDLFFAAAKAARDGTFYAQARQRKPYLSKEVLDRWGIGKAPSLKQCKKAGLDVAELASLGLFLLGRRGDHYPHFRDAMIFPYYERGRIVYVSSRRLVDHDPKTHKELDKSEKARSALAPRDDGGGLERPAGFNLDVLQGRGARGEGSGAEAAAPHILLVEGVLDAIACCERGHPAIAYLGGSIREDLAERVRTAFPCGQGVYIAPDATKDVTPRKRAELAGLIGPLARCVLLPEGKDPDEVEAAAWPKLLAEAPTAVEAWIDVFPDAPDEWPAGLSDDFRKVVREWLQQAFTARDEIAATLIRASIYENFGLRDADLEAWLAPKSLRPIAEARPEAYEPDLEADVDPEALANAAPPHDPVAPSPAGARLPEGDVKAWLDDELPHELARIDSTRGVARDAETYKLFERLAEILDGVSPITKERVKEAVCKELKLSKTAFNAGLREGQKSLEKKRGTAVIDQMDWKKVAEAWLEKVATGEWAVA